MIYKHPRATWLNPNTGQLIDHFTLMHNMAQKQVVLLGEKHDVAEIHRWQMHVIAALHTIRKNIAVGFEMFPRRLQPVLDEWMNGELSTEGFIEKSEWYQVWGFPADIYLPIFHFCRQNNIRMLALNCYRELVTRIGKDGWDSVLEQERDGLTPAAPPTEDYIASFRRWLGTPENPWQPTDRFLRAQSTWDRAFACNIAKAIDEAKEKGEEAPLVIGIIGGGHMFYKQGSVYQLEDLRVHDVGVLLTNDQEKLDSKKTQGIADAIFRIDTPDPKVKRLNMPKNQA
ncbi:MAG: ChaN family lipoprotein [Saezia sp.]